MNRNPRVLYKTLIVGTIILFFVIGLQPVFAKVKEIPIIMPKLNQEDTKHLANLTISFSEIIYNENIDYEHERYRPIGNYSINLNVNFNCPPDKKISISYWGGAELTTSPPYDERDIYFFDIDKSITIINGSNPPNINLTYEEYVPSYRNYNIYLYIGARLVEYEFFQGHWVWVSDDEAGLHISETVGFGNARTAFLNPSLPNFKERFLRFHPLMKNLFDIIRNPLTCRNNRGF